MTGDLNDVMPGSDGLRFFVILNRSGDLRFGLRRSELIFRTWVRPVHFVNCRVRTRVGWVSELRADDGRTVSIEKLCLSLLVSKNLNLKKVIKNSYVNQESRQCFMFFGFLCIMYISHIRIMAMLHLVKHRIMQVQHSPYSTGIIPLDFFLCS